MEFPLSLFPAQAVVLAQWLLPLSLAWAGQAWIRRGLPAGWLSLALGGALLGLFTASPGLAMVSLWTGGFLFMAHWLHHVLLEADAGQAGDPRHRRG